MYGWKSMRSYENPSTLGWAIDNELNNLRKETGWRATYQSWLLNIIDQLLNMIWELFFDITPPWMKLCNEIWWTLCSWTSNWLCSLISLSYFYKLLFLASCIIKKGRRKKRTHTPYTQQTTTFLYNRVCFGIRSLLTLSLIPLLRGATFDIVLDKYMKSKNIWIFDGIDFYPSRM